MCKPDLCRSVARLTLLACFWSVASLAAPLYYTDHGTGPDKWASVWYLERVAYESGSVAIVSQSEIDQLDIDQLFDVHQGRFNRTGASTTYSAIVQHYPPLDDIALRLGDIIHEIEIDAWSGQVSLESQLVGQAFRGMQLRYGRVNVTKACYLRFFDTVAMHLMNDSLSRINSPDRLMPPQFCREPGPVDAKSKAVDKKVPTLPLADVLAKIASGRTPAFVDTRESWEFDEGHIPGAVNIKLREINVGSASLLQSSETVIAYCVKDFRGYEAARKLRSLGVNAVIMTPHGMRGWVNAQLPVAGSRGSDESQALRELMRMAGESAKGS